MAKREYNTLGWLRFAWAIMAFAIVLSLTAGGAFIKSHGRMVKIETDYGHLHEEVAGLRTDVKAIEKLLMAMVK